MPKRNDFGRPLTAAGRKYQRSLELTKQAARHGVANMPAPPATKQWACPACRHPNLARDTVCNGCGEERDGRQVIEDERSQTERGDKRKAS